MGEGLGRYEDEEVDERNAANPIYKNCISTEVEELALNKKAIGVLFAAILKYRQLEISPKMDPIVRKKYGILKQEPREMKVV